MVEHPEREDKHAYREISVEDAIVGRRPYDKPEYLYELYWEKGETQAEIADTFDVHRSTITKAMNRHGIPTRPQVDDQERTSADTEEETA